MKLTPTGFRFKSQRPNEGAKVQTVKFNRSSWKIPHDLREKERFNYHLYRQGKPTWVEKKCMVCQLDFMTRVKNPKKTCSRKCATVLFGVNNALRHGKPIYYVVH